MPDDLASFLVLGTNVDDKPVLNTLVVSAFDQNYDRDFIQSLEKYLAV